jgi:two-component system, chemotaxis family, chemotaxis protein CheY
MAPCGRGFLPVSPDEEATLPKILVIDDDSQVRGLISHILEMEGHTVVEAKNGIEGVIRHRAELPDLVITDMVMPEQGGAETIIKIRQETPAARIIAVSGGGTLDGTHPLIVAKKLGVMETLHKPFTMTELIDCVTRTLDGVLVHNNQPSQTVAA